METVIEGCVARILDEYRVVMSVGSNDGVKIGMVFVIIAQSEEEIRDPASNEVLGKLENVKDYVSVIHVQDRISTCVAKERTRGFQDGAGMGVQTLSGAMMAESMTARPEKERYETQKLFVNAAQITGTPQLGPISVGDKVRSVGSKG
ncbi:MAG: hypothetical protein D8M57_05790 [Candidatus Scalindua sp. AMX11]|nr:MAG: hypothetical protein DWQ00_12740 [Candidatus Scalindua sp.]NOG82851.1 hypothetical protein [Planctomycetota bacterium]RZV86197.1 MAG: hypothetical protein EX341_07460 [Candidatus Scalindua sp. SCAELEC01]TDE65817.1 MAG: hypothetical protein D8M57_05790 [Candidatus Scalindua sp. AMX11]GJQ58322.1 MAG: hypothetical protein SCALA701_11230 [Candidatus Scalindua sp.]